jgi:hypothetical protein
LKGTWPIGHVPFCFSVFHLNGYDNHKRGRDAAATKLDKLKFCAFRKQGLYDDRNGGYDNHKRGKDAAATKLDKLKFCAFRKQGLYDDRNGRIP